jgi:hypothetical protein
MWFFIGLVVIGNFYVVGVAPVPAEADTVLIVCAEAVLAGAASLQRFEAVARGDSKFVEV